MAQRDLLARLLAPGPIVLDDPDWPSAAADAARRELTAVRLRPDDLVVFSSGSTGRPRGIVRSRASWDAGVPGLTSLIAAAGPQLVWIAGRLASSMFSYAAWHALAVGWPMVLADEADPAALSRVTVAHLPSGRLAGLVTRRRAGDLAALHTVVVAGERLDPAVRESAHAEGLRVVEYYGAAELSFVGWADRDGPLRAFPGVEVGVRGGVLWSRSAQHARGYLGAPGPLVVDDQGWASVGDLGRAAGDGFVVLGRGDAAVTTGGHTVVVEEVERELRLLSGVSDAAATGVADPLLGQRLVAIVALASHCDLGVVRAAVRDWPAPSRPRRWLVVPAVPRNAAGKVDRAAVAALATKESIDAP